ncbi:hypothetical protein SDC9_160763 [bioreactor metagenome]|uniref:Uncharacterized protein n=1 Tax=bioreactor metagenome TaxID=1076179 RepID=A0A645FIT7_9ZZZZ
MDELYAHHLIIVKEFSRVFPVGADAAYLGCQVNNDVRFGII